MSEDFTQKLPKNENGSEILTAIKNLDDRLQGLEKKVDERLHDTRPIWHKVVADIAELQAGQTRLEDGQQRLEEGQQAIRKDLGELSHIVHQVNRDQIVINDSHRRIQLDLLTVNENSFTRTASPGA